MNYLESIVARTRREVQRRLRRASAQEVWRRALARAAAPRPVLPALQRREGTLRVIGEIKFRSPSKGKLRERPAGEALRIARSYEEAGAAALSVLADRYDFEGGVLDVRRVAQVAEIPVLFKGFVVDPLQVALARAVGASMVLLIVRALDPLLLAELVDAVHEQGMEAVVEAADLDELERGLSTPARVLGFNARDLRTFVEDSGLAAEGVARIPGDRIAVWMSGIRSPKDLLSVSQSRADAVLIGEGLMTAADPGARLRELLAYER